jgi:hypothetical protein
MKKPMSRNGILAASCSPSLKAGPKRGIASTVVEKWTFVSTVRRKLMFAAMLVKKGTFVSTAGMKQIVASMVVKNRSFASVVVREGNADVGKKRMLAPMGRGGKRMKERKQKRNCRTREVRKSAWKTGPLSSGQHESKGRRSFRL